MNKFIKKYWWLLILLFILPATGLLFILVKRVTINQTTISLLCAALTYLGTVLLAFVTILQNDKITEFSKQNAAIEEVRLRNKYHPVIDIKSIQDINEKDYSYNSLYKNGFGFIMQIKDIKEDAIYIVLNNSGNASAYNIKAVDYGYNPAIAKNDTEEIFDYKEISIPEIEKDSSCYLTLHFFKNASFSMRYNICYQNEFGHGFYNPILIDLNDNNGERTAQIGINPQTKKDGIIDYQESYHDLSCISDVTKSYSGNNTEI